MEKVPDLSVLVLSPELFYILKLIRGREMTDCVLFFRDIFSA